MIGTQKTEDFLVLSAYKQYRGWKGYHSGERDRFIITAPDFNLAARTAAHLGWWLHCWSWQETDVAEITIADQFSRAESTQVE